MKLPKMAALQHHIAKTFNVELNFLLICSKAQNLSLQFFLKCTNKETLLLSTQVSLKVYHSLLCRSTFRSLKVLHKQIFQNHNFAYYFLLFLLKHD